MSGERGIRHKFAQFYRPYMLVLPAIAFLIFFYFLPSLYNIALSTQEISLFGLAGKGGEFVGLKNYIKLVKDTLFPLTLKNTALWLTGATVLARLILGFGIALLLNSRALKRWHLGGIARVLIFLPWGVPPVAAIAIWKWMLNTRYGIVNLMLLKSGVVSSPVGFLTSASSVWISIILIVVWRELPFVVVTYLAGLQSIPQELYEAARIDGATWFAQLRYLTIPLLKPVTGIIGFMITIWTFNNFVYVWNTTRGGPGHTTQVLGTMVYFKSFVQYKVGYGATFGVVMTLLMMLFAFFYFRKVFSKTL